MAADTLQATIAGNPLLAKHCWQNIE